MFITAVLPACTLSTISWRLMRVGDGLADAHVVEERGLAVAALDAEVDMLPERAGHILRVDRAGRLQFVQLRRRSPASGRGDGISISPVSSWASSWLTSAMYLKISVPTLGWTAKYGLLTSVVCTPGSCSCNMNGPYDHRMGCLGVADLGDRHTLVQMRRQQAKPRIDLIVREVEVARGPSSGRS